MGTMIGIVGTLGTVFDLLQGLWDSLDRAGLGQDKREKIIGDFLDRLRHGERLTRLGLQCRHA